MASGIAVGKYLLWFQSNLKIASVHIGSYLSLLWSSPQSNLEVASVHSGYSLNSLLKWHQLLWKWYQSALEVVLVHFGSDLVHIRSGLGPLLMWPQPIFVLSPIWECLQTNLEVFSSFFGSTIEMAQAHYRIASVLSESDINLI